MAIMTVCLSLTTTKAYVEFIGREKARAYLQCIYCKVKQWVQREMSHTIKSRCACVWMYNVYIWWLTYFYYAPWKHISLLKLRNNFARKHGLSYSSLFFPFSSGHLSTHYFKYPRHLSIFFSFLFFFLLLFLWITFA